MSDMVRLSKVGSIGVMSVDNPPVNALSIGVRQGLADCLAEALRDAEIRALVVICEGRTFLAGADIREFGKPPQPPHLPDVIDALEKSPKPIVAAIHGTALGGGLEVALGCHYRVAVGSATCGFPEVKLGILPGAGGTQRAPRVMGVKPALDLIVNGNPISAAEARQLGLLDQIVEGDLLEGAVAFAREVAAVGPSLPRTSELNEKIQEAKGKPELFTDYEKDIRRKKRGFEAPLRCIEAVKAAVDMPFREGLARERDLFAACVASDQSVAQRHVFFAEREVAKIPEVPKETPLISVNKVGIIGAGTMGGGISMCFANAGLPVLLLDQSREFLNKGMGVIEKNYGSTVKRGGLSQEDMDKRMGLITPTVSYDGLADVDLVIEAVFEEMPLKREIFGKLDAVCRPDAIMATNTSTLDVNEIARATSRPEQVIGLHFFSPAHIMRLLEIVRGEKTSKPVIATSMNLARLISKIGVLVGVCHGFVGNRILHKYSREASFLVEEGALPQQVDKVITDFGLPMGPFAMGDLAGLDVGWRIRKAQGKPKDERYSGTVGDRLAEQGRYGQKTGKGYYKYEAGSRTPITDPEVEKLVVEVSKELGIKRREIGDEEILKRCIYPMINEGAKILEEGIALRSSNIDIIWINGYGFPAYRGGPMHYGERVGLKNVYDQICTFRREHGPLWEPAPLLKRLAEQGKGFSEM